MAGVARAVGLAADKEEVARAVGLAADKEEVAEEKAVPMAAT